MPLDGLNIEVSNQRGPAVFAITPQSAALRSGKIEMPMPSLRRIARFVLGSFFRPSERVELLADASEVSAKAEPGESVRPFSHPKDAPELFWVRLRIDYPSWGPVHVHPTSTLNAKASAGDYVITLCDDGSTTLTLSAGPPPQAEMILQEHGLHPEDRQRHYWVQSPPLQPWSAKQLIALIGALHRFTRVDLNFWERLRGKEVEEEEPIKPVSERKVVVDGAVTKREIAWRPERLAKDDDEVVWLDIAKFDELWRGDIDFYIEPKKGIYNRYADVGNWIMAGNDVGLPSVYGDRFFADTGAVSFVNGRHRFSWVRDHGARAIPVIMDKNDCAEIKRRCGTDERIWLPVAVTFFLSQGLTPKPVAPR